jgi:hypothetical protein
MAEECPAIPVTWPEASQSSSWHCRTQKLRHRRVSRTQQRTETWENPDHKAATAHADCLQRLWLGITSLLHSWSSKITPRCLPNDDQRNRQHERANNDILQANLSANEKHRNSRYCHHAENKPDAEHDDEAAWPLSSLTINVPLSKERLERASRCIRTHRCTTLGAKVCLWLIRNHATHTQLLLARLSSRLGRFF